jgi:hypothetical protein
VYPVWRRKVRAAQTGITVFAPFMDRLLMSLLSINSTLPPTAVTVVTDFSSELLLELPNQLKTIKRLMQNGVQVLRLDGLHAKVLLVDETAVVLGSQNFTSRARRNREVSASPLPSLAGTRFLETLQVWRSKAQPVDEDYIDMLLARLRRHVKRHKEIHKDAGETLRKADEEYERQKQDNLLRRLADLEKQSRIRIAHGAVYATIQSVMGPWDAFDTLLADPEYDMTRWSVTNPDGKTEPYRISRLSMFPMLIPETMRMGFARVGKTRITYIRKSLDWTNRKLQVGDLFLNVSITFPDTDTKRRNITIKLTDSWRGSCDCAFLFTGDSVRLVKHTFHRGSPHWEEEHRQLTDLLDKDFFGRSEAMDEFFRRFFDHFTYAELGRDDHNVRDYLKGTRFRLSVIQYMNNPFLVVRKEW